MRKTFPRYAVELFNDAVYKRLELDKLFVIFGMASLYEGGKTL